MPSFSKRLSVPLVLVLLVVPALAGCSVQGIVNNVTGGKVTLPGKSVPSDFPKSVPLAQGTVELGGAIGDDKSGRIWNVTIQGDSATMEAISAQLTGAGFTDNGAISTTSDGGTGSFDNGTYGIIVVVAKTSGKQTANYTVTTDAKK